MNDYETPGLTDSVEQVVQETAVQPAAVVEVTLCEKHTHNGVEMGPGDILELPSPTAAFLVDSGVAKYL